MYSQKYANRPIQFISVNSFGKIVLHAEAVAFIRTLAPPISFASILGPSKTGKSFLMSQIISQSQSFVEQPTQGLWIWSRPILAYNQDNNVASIILVDSEGFSMGERDKEKIIISLILLLSDCLLYNSIGPIDSISFNELEEVMSIARELKDKNGEFHWILRDFDPSLVDKLGIYITPVQYMENMLMQAEKTSAEKTITTLKQNFPNRSCHCFIKPTPSSVQQPPQFLKQIIQLRKRLNGVSSSNLDGTSLVIIIESFIESLNSGDSILKASQQGNDSKIRLQCISKLQDELRDLQQKQSANEIDDIDEHLSEIRTHLKEYYKQKMCSHRQIQTLDEELNEIIQDFQDVSYVQAQRNSIQSREIIRLNVPKEKMVRLSLNISESEKERMDFDSRQVISMNKINTTKSLQNKLEDFQTKVYRYELEATCSKRELQGLKDDYDRSKRQLDLKTDQIQSLIQETSKKEKDYVNKIYDISQKLEDLRKQKIMVESQLQKIKILNSQKIQYLEEQLCELSELKEFQLQQKQEKYKNKFNEYAKEISQLKKSHEQQLLQLKKIYKDNQEQLIESKQQERNQTFYKEMREQMELLQKMKEEKDSQKFAKNEQLEINKELNKQLENKEQQYKDALQQQAKRAKEAERRLEEVYTAKMQSKTRIIEQLQQKINDILKTKQISEESTSQIINENNRLIAELEQKEHRLTKVSTKSQQTLRELTRMKDYLQQCESTISALNEDLKKKDEDIKFVTSENQRLQDLQKILQNKIEEKTGIVQKLQHQASELKGQLSILQQTSQIQIEDLKEKYENQIQQLKAMFETERQRLLNKIKEQQNYVDSLRNLRQQYDELQQDSAEAQFQLRQMLDEKERQLQSHKGYVNELTRECEILSKKKSQLLADFIRVKEEAIQNTRQSVENEEKYREELQSNLEKIQQNKAEKEKIIYTLKIQLQKEKKSNATKIEFMQKENEQLQTKMKNINSEFNKQTQASKEALQRSQKIEEELNQQIVVLNHKLSLQQKSLSFKSQTKSIELNKLLQKVKSLEAKGTSSNSLASNYYDQLKRYQEQSGRLKKMLSIFYKQKEIALSNIEEQSNRFKIAQRRYESHLNLFSEKIKEIKEENEQLRQRLEQYIVDYQTMSDMKENLERTLEREIELSRNKLEIAYQQIRKQ